MRLFFAWIGLSFVLIFVNYNTAFANPMQSAQTGCEGNGGAWVDYGPGGGETGYCTFPAGSSIAQSVCNNSNQYVYEYYVSGNLISQSCLTSGGGGGAYGYGNYGSLYFSRNLFKHHITDDKAGEFDMQKKNGVFDYDIGTCSGKCIISSTIPYPALKTLPDDATDKLYVRLVDGNGDSGEGSYTICFDTGKITNPIIYRYVGGAWMQQPISISGGQVCTQASGDGVFALGGNTDIQHEEEEPSQPAPYVYPYP